MHNRIRISRWALAVACALLLATPALAAEPVKDSTIAMWVAEALRLDPLVEAASIEVATANGIVTLSGHAGSLAVRTRAAQEAKKIRGVRAVVNEIIVTPSVRPDASIVSDVRRRILNDAVIESEGIHVTSSAGVVKLDGQVATWSEAEQAALVASEVRGVKQVENEILTRYPTVRSDQEIKNDAVATLERDVYVVGLPLTVEVERGTITLTGTVGSTFEKDRAAREVRWIPQVKSVDNRLEVEPWENRGARKKSASPSDASLRTAVRDALVQDERVEVSKIDVRAHQGHVTFEGSVPNHAQKRIAEQDARDVVGVAWVTNELFANSDRRTDEAVRDDIVFGFDTDITLEKLDLDATVKDGVVTLTGTVHSWYPKFHAEEVAGRVRGVRGLESEIRVERTTGTTSTHSAAAVENEIRKSFTWHWATHWVADRIQVSVKDGVATLTGDVDTWAQRREAGRLAFRNEGVWKVSNRLSVHGYAYDWETWDEDAPLIYDYYDYGDAWD